MRNLAAVTAVLGLAAGLAACSSSGSSTARATAAAKATSAPVPGTETISGKLTGPAAASDILVFHLRLTGPVSTTGTITLIGSGNAPPHIMAVSSTSAQSRYSCQCGVRNGSPSR